jgi:hypothetical protein
LRAEGALFVAPDAGASRAAGASFVDADAGALRAAGASFIDADAGVLRAAGASSFDADAGVLRETAAFSFDGGVRDLAGTFDPPEPWERLHVEALRTATPPTIDGRLEESVWLQAKVAGGFVQVEPKQGSPATHATEVRVLFDNDALYIGARLQQPDGFNQRNLKRDFEGHESDSFGVLLDTFGDGRNAFSFQVNPYGAQRDIQVLDDALTEPNWDTVWSTATTRDAQGWTVEMAIPFKSLRRGEGRAPWRVQLFRRERGRNEDTVFSPFPRVFSPWRMAYAAQLDGLEAPPPRALDVQLRPYGIVRLDRAGEGAPLLLPSAGGEVTLSPSASTAIDLTVNTDFAETDVDRRVVNLRRFSVLFPERRQFFLESASVFTVGNSSGLQPFFSRSVGLTGEGKPTVVYGGARLVHRSTARSVGALVVATGPAEDTPQSLVAVLRESENLGGQSRVGGMVVARHDFASAQGAARTNVVPALDGLWRSGSFTLTGAVMGSITAGADLATRTGVASRVEATYETNLFSMSASGLLLTPDFEARSGFVDRAAVAGVELDMGTDLRPSWLPSAIRRVGPFAEGYALWGTRDGKFQEASGYLSPLWMEFRGGDELWLFVELARQELTEAFAPIPKVSFGPGAYGYERVGVAGLSQASRKLSLRGDVSVGRFYSAQELRASAGLSVQPIAHVSVSANYQYGRFWGEGVEGPFAESHLLLVEARLALNPKLQLIGSFQRDAAGNALVANARLAWEFRPPSFVYLVFTDTRRAYPAPDAPPAELRVVLKATYTWRP